MQPQSHESVAHRSDEELIQLVAAGDENAYEALYDRHGQVIYSLIMRIVRDNPVADELLQEIFLLVWRNAAQYQGRGAGQAWLYRIARNRALDYLRRRQARPQASDVDVEETGHLRQTHQPSAEMETEMKIRQEQVWDAMAQIPQEQRICLELAYFQGLSQSEIAASTATPLGTVKSRIRIGMEKLERVLRGQGFVESE